MKDKKEDQLLIDAIRAHELGVSYGYYIGALKQYDRIRNGSTSEDKESDERDFRQEVDN